MLEIGGFPSEFENGRSHPENRIQHPSNRCSDPVTILPSYPEFWMYPEPDMWHRKS